MTFIYKQGNILDSEENIICQSVNHQGIMGAGLAKQIKQKYTNVMDSYLKICDMRFSDIKRNGIVAWCTIDKNKYIASIFGQEYYGTDKQYTDYVSLGNGFETVKSFANRNNCSIAIPYGIGCGLGGGDWNVVSDIIERCFLSLEINISIYSYKDVK